MDPIRPDPPNRGRGGHPIRGRGGGGGNHRGNRGGGAQNRPRADHRVMHPIGYQALREKLTADPGDLLVELNSDRSPMRPHLTNRELYRERPDFVDLLLGVLSRAVECQSSPVLRNQLYGFLSGSPFFRTVVHEKLLDRRFGTGDAAWPAMANYLKVAEGMVVAVVDAWRIVHPFILELLEQIKEWNAIGWTAPADGQELLQRVIGGIKTAREQQQRQQERATLKASGVDLGPPPEDFRELSIFPAAEDLKVRKPYLRANKTDGAYDDCEHYLDVQFRLLREDFMGPLRIGVSKYQEQLRLKQAIGRLQDIKVYTGVVILGAVASQSGLTYRIRFDTSKIRNIRRLMASKRLIYGALLCLSADNFENIYIATVQEKNIKDIVRGELELMFEGPSAAHIQAIDYSTMEFTMVETTAYFESYRHVLEGLKDVKPDVMPFQRYIVRCSCTGDNQPAYLPNVMFTYDLRCIAPPDLPSANRDRLRQVLVQPHARWPTEADLGLDASQLAALRLALSNEFAVIQGPPGTGKTYIGLKIVRVLLANLEDELPSVARLNLRGVQPAAARDQGNAASAVSPILVVCYTNHALDQFLEGIYEYAAGGIVRVGGRSVSEKMQQCTINKMRDNKLNSPALRQRYFQVRSEIQERRSRTVFIAKKMQMSDRGLLKFHVVEQFIQENHAWQLRPNDAWGSSADFLTAWLDLAPLPGPPPGTSDDLNQLEDEHNRDVNGDRAGQGEAQQGPEGEAEDESSDEDTVEIDEAVFETKQRKLEDSDDEDVGVRAMALQELEADEMAVNFQELAMAPKSRQDHGATGPVRGANADNDGWQTVRKKMNPKQLLKKLRTTKPMTPEEEQHVSNIWELTVNTRWRLYLTWVCRYRKELSDQLVRESAGHDAFVRELKELRMQGDVNVLRRAKVIGMTTTGAARYRHVLQEVKPRIVIVEEAAEVLEAHIVTTLSTSCEHLILIGDHKQLRPNPTVFELAKTYKLDVSLFERMVQNKLPFRTLSTQHRMRPEISYVMRHIYENLQDHESVRRYENIKGMKHNLFYVTHTEHEDHDDTLSSHSNNFEAQFVVALCRYLRQQGYAPSQVTILTPYTGQLLLLRQLMRDKQDYFDGVRVTSIDNYQGEENDIILLSTVRSNNEGRVGFTNVSNRVCVALSRAKKGMYVFGNFEMLEKHSDLWRKILSDVAKDRKLGKQLPLICQAHGQETSVGCAQDFAKAIEGGCSAPCGARLPCGHSCDRMCHPFESDHEIFKCQKPCRRVLSCGHECKRACSAECGQCTVSVERVLPCGHAQQMACGADVRAQRCRAPCIRMLSCGLHRCSGSCGDTCPTSCTRKVKRVYSCSHTNEVLCHQSEDDAPCQHPCGAELKCSHPCTGTCGICKQGRLHKPCSEECKRPLVCGHLCEGRCCNGCPPCKKPCENRCPHSQCKKACGEPCMPCREPCTWQCEHYRCTRLCSEPCNRPRCDQPCHRLVRCRRRHQEAPCIGLCGEPCPRVCDRCKPARPYRQVFFGTEADDDARFLQLEDCGHVVESSGMDHWMELEATSNQDGHGGGGAGSIQLKQCPICKTPVRRSVRYGVLVNAQLDDIERVKAKIRHDEKAVKLRFEAIKTEAVLSGLNGDLNASTTASTPTANNVDILNFQLQCLKQIRKLTMAEPTISVDLLAVKKFVLDLEGMLRKQEIDDVASELTRLDYQAMLAAAQRAVRSSGNTPYELSRALLQAAQLLTGRLDERKKASLKELEPVLRRYTGISREEKDMIMQAMGFGQKGHWYKCPKNHIYCIGDCGGATVEAKCPECGSAIGGTSHRLRDDNAVATEMDGATRPAFSEANNVIPPHLL